MNNEKEIDKYIKLLTILLKYGFSSLVALSGIILIYLGSIGKSMVPHSYYAGGFILLISIIYYIGEIILKIIKTKCYNSNSIKKDKKNNVCKI